jgi:hypothetical protein
VLETIALSLGPEVAALPGTAGRVLAVLRNAVYLENAAGHIACLVAEDGVDGPLTLRVRDLSAILGGLRAHPDAAFAATDHALEIVQVTRIRWEAAPRWTPLQPASIGAAPDRRAAVEMLVSLSAAWGPLAGEGADDGCFAEFTLSLRSGRALERSEGLSMTVARRLAARLKEFAAAFQAGDRDVATAALLGLLGLGPGLTPAGDDVVMGLLAGLVWQAGLGLVPGEFVTHLVCAVRAAAPNQTNRISARLLWHAGAGVLYAPAMAVGAALLAGDPAAVAAPARRLFAIGHTSGRDLALGLGSAIQIGAASR